MHGDAGAALVLVGETEDLEVRAALNAARECVEHGLAAGSRPELQANLYLALAAVTAAVDLFHRLNPES
jgi:hypothetical protein